MAFAREKFRKAAKVQRWRRRDVREHIWKKNFHEDRSKLDPSSCAQFLFVWNFDGSIIYFSTLRADSGNLQMGKFCSTHKLGKVGRRELSVGETLPQRIWFYSYFTATAVTSVHWALSLSRGSIPAEEQPETLGRVLGTIKMINTIVTNITSSQTETDFNNWELSIWAAGANAFHLDGYCIWELGRTTLCNQRIGQFGNTAGCLRLFQSHGMCRI